MFLLLVCDKFFNFVQASMQKMCLGSCSSRLERLQSE